MKKILSVAFSAIMAVSACYALSACGEQGEETDGTQVTQEEWTAAFEVFCDDVNESLWNKKVNIKENLKITADITKEDESYPAMAYGFIYDGGNHRFYSNQIDQNEVVEILGYVVMVNNGVKTYYAKPYMDEWRSLNETDPDHQEDVSYMEVEIVTYTHISVAFSLAAPFYERASYNEEEKSYAVTLSYSETLKVLGYPDDELPKEDDTTKSTQFTLRFEKKKLVSCVAEFPPQLNNPFVGGRMEYKITYGGQKVEAPIS